MIRLMRYAALHTYNIMKVIRFHLGWLISIPLVTTLVIIVNAITANEKAISEWTWLEIVSEVFSIHSYLHSEVWLESLTLGLVALGIGSVLRYRWQRQLKAYLNQHVPILQNQSESHDDGSLPHWNDLVKAVAQASYNQATLVLLRVAPETTNQPPLSLSDSSKLQFLVSEMLEWNLPESTQTFRLTGENYALLSSVPIAQEQINDVVLLLRAMRFRGEKRALATHLQVTARTVVIEGSLCERALKDKLQDFQTGLVGRCDGIQSRHSITDVQVA